MLSRIREFFSPDVSGIYIQSGRGWKISGGGTRDHRSVFLHLGAMVPDGSILYLEAPCDSSCEPQYLQIEVPENIRSKVRIGTIYPKPRFFHVPAVGATFELLTDLSKTRCGPEVCVHFVVYKSGEVLVSAYDAFSDPIFCSARISESAVRNFSAAVGGTYETVTIPS